MVIKSASPSSWNLIFLSGHGWIESDYMHGFKSQLTNSLAVVPEYYGNVDMKDSQCGITKDSFFIKFIYLFSGCLNLNWIIYILRQRLARSYMRLASKSDSVEWHHSIID